MKRLLLNSPLLILVILLANSSCKKDNNTESPTLLRSINAPINTAPKVNAGEDIWLAIPGNTCLLSGTAVDDQNNIVKYAWKQLSGPTISHFEASDSIKTKVYNLTKGTYEFELNVTDSEGLTSRDVVGVTVYNPAPAGHGEVVFKDLQWYCPMGCTLWIDCFPCIVPINQAYKVFLKRDNSNDWIEVVSEKVWTGQERYAYGFYNGALYIYTNDDGAETPDVKIVF